MELRPYQRSLMRQIRDCLPKHAHPLFVLPTGAGKTGVAGAIAAKVAREGWQVLYLLHRRELMDQTVATLGLFGLSEIVGMIAAGYPARPWARVQVASVFTVSRRLQSLMAWLKPRLIIIDEAHHIRADTWMRILDAFPNAYWIGCTATPMRLDRKGLAPHFDHLIVGPGFASLTPEYLCPIDAYSLPSGVDLASFRMGQNDYTRASLASNRPVVAKVWDNWRAIASGKRTLYFAPTIDDSKEKVAMFRAKGIPAEHIDFRTDKTLRADAMERFRAGQTTVLSNVELFTEGVDCPWCECVMLGRKTGSFTLYRQMTGRLSRPKPDGASGILLDLVGNVDQHGGPTEDVDWDLDYGAPEEQLKKAKAKGRTCQNCGFVHAYREPQCPLCGHVLPKEAVREADIDLIKVQTPRRRKSASGIHRQVMQDVFQSGGRWDEIERIRKEHGYRPGWSRHMMRTFEKAWGRLNSGG